MQNMLKNFPEDFFGDDEGFYFNSIEPIRRQQAKLEN